MYISGRWGRREVPALSFSEKICKGEEKKDVKEERGKNKCKKNL
jgi:hypothetical protein